MKKLFLLPNQSTGLLLLTFELLLFCLVSFAQQSKIDSLQTCLKKTLHDTDRVSTLNALSWQLYLTGNYDTTLIYASHAKRLAEKINFKKGIAASYNNIGNVYSDQGNYPDALRNHFASLKVREEIGDKKGIAISYNNIGVIYQNQGDYPKALDYYFRALKINKELGSSAKGGSASGEKNRIAGNLNNIGIIYQNQGDYPKALEYFFKALKINEELGDKNGIAINLGNIGSVYEEQAIAASPDSAAYRERLFNKALDYNFKALKMAEELGNKNHIAAFLSNIGWIYTKTRKFIEAEKYLSDALKLTQETGAQNYERQFEELLSELYEKMGRHQLALEHYKKAMVLKDTIFSEEKDKEITRREMNYEFEKKEAAAKAEQEKKDAVAAAENKKQKIFIWSTITVLMLVVVFSVFIFNRWRITQRQKKVIEMQQTKILDSIDYAKLIQDSILPSEEEFIKHFSDHFIFYQPKDIVSGDFYWISNQNGKTILAVADCTGHGVPGAFMSMIGNTLLNEIVNEKDIFHPAEILMHLHEGIVHALHQESRSQGDGMDISVCLFEKDKITFAGANHSLYLVKKNSLDKITGNIFSIGGTFWKKDISFSQKEIPVKQNMNVFFCSDGFADQRGGTAEKKFSTRVLEQAFLEISDMNGNSQEQFLRNKFNSWKGNYEQLDDVMVIGIKI